MWHIEVVAGHTSAANLHAVRFSGWVKYRDTALHHFRVIIVKASQQNAHISMVNCISLPVPLEKYQIHARVSSTFEVVSKLTGAAPISCLWFCSLIGLRRFGAWGIIIFVVAMTWQRFDIYILIKQHLIASPSVRQIILYKPIDYQPLLMLSWNERRSEFQWELFWISAQVRNDITETHVKRAQCNFIRRQYGVRKYWYLFFMRRVRGDSNLYINSNWYYHRRKENDSKKRAPKINESQLTGGRVTNAAAMLIRRISRNISSRRG